MYVKIKKIMKIMKIMKIISSNLNEWV